MPGYNKKITDITEDYFYKKKVIILQRKKGYRFSIDAPLLADFLPALPTQKALEIGTGCGIVSMLALYKKKFAKIYGIEIQEKLSTLAQTNAQKNGFMNYFQVIHGDFNEIYTQLPGAGTIFSNPPFFELNRGRLSPNEEIRHAKSETKLTLRQLLEKTYALLKPNGSLYLILPYDRFPEFMDISTETGFFIRKSREIFSFKDGKPERFLVQLTNYNVSTEKMTPLIIFKEKGIYTDEMDKILTGDQD
ncbi:MAG: methyltransferase [bacterium]|nr:methyltransferase [bacterium]